MKPGQKRIVIASVLKPLDDTRMFEKMGASLADSGRYDLFIIGYPITHEIKYPNTTFLPLQKFKRISFGRLFASFSVLKKTLKVKPEVLIINSHELLLVAVLNRILFGTRIIYDVRENYFRNLLHTKSFPSVLKVVLAIWVRVKEKLYAPLFNWFFLAEKGYEKEMTFFTTRYTILENKAMVPADFIKSAKNPDVTRLLFSGTLAETTGVFQAIQLTHQLHQSEPEITLKIIGYCAQLKTLHRIKEAIGDASYIQLIGGDHLVPHHQIMRAIGESDFGIICYPPSLHTQNSIPTKLYEYLACGLPVLIQNHRPWIELSLPIQAAISVDFNRPNISEILQKMKDENFYLGTPENVTWKEESVKLLQVLEKEIL